MITHIDKTCPHCGKCFTVSAHEKKQKYCSMLCRRNAKAIKSEIRSCENCGKDIIIIISHPRQTPRRFCSIHCAMSGRFNPMYGRIRTGPNAPMWGKHLSEETKQKLRTKALLRPAPSAATRKKLATWTDRKHSQETRHKMAETRRAIWADEEFRKKMRGVLPTWTQMQPNGLEKRVIAMMPRNVRYVGNGAFWKLLPSGNRKNPDFKVTGENKVIEMFGDYWHRGENPNDLINQ